MKRTHLIIALCSVVALATGVILIASQNAGVATAQGADPAAVSVTAATVSSRISYQGVLKEGGSPVTGNRNFTFRLYTNAGCTTLVGSPIALTNVPVNNGLFSVKLDADQALFDGQGLWLGVDVGSTGSNTACEEITPAPYALSLRPGAVIVGSIANSPIISVTNTYSPTVGAAAVAKVSGALAGYGDAGYGLLGLWGGALAGEGEDYGVFGKSKSGWGVHGSSESSSGIVGDSDKGSGVLGFSRNAAGGEFITAGRDSCGLVAKNDAGGKAAKFEGGVDINGDLNLTGEVYAQSLHTKDGSGAITSGVTTKGNANFKQVQVPGAAQGQQVTVGPSGVQVQNTGSTSPTVSITYQGVAKFNEVNVSGAGGSTTKMTDGGFRTTGSDGRTTAGIYSTSGEAYFQGGTYVPNGMGGWNVVNQTGFQVQTSEYQPLAGIDPAGGVKGTSIQVPLLGGGKFQATETGVQVQNAEGAPVVDINLVGDLTSKSVQTGNAQVNGNLNVAGNSTVAGTKTAVVSTASHGPRKLYADESAEVYFFDRGGGKLVNGVAVIALDPVWLETVTIDADHPMRVQVTLTGDCNGVYVAEKTIAGFTVRELRGGVSNATFDWEVAAKRKGYEDERLAPFTVEQP